MSESSGQSIINLQKPYYAVAQHFFSYDWNEFLSLKKILEKKIQDAIHPNFHGELTGKRHLCCITAAYGWCHSKAPRQKPQQALIQWKLSGTAGRVGAGNLCCFWLQWRTDPPQSYHELVLAGTPVSSSAANNAKPWQGLLMLLNPLVHLADTWKKTRKPQSRAQAARKP